ISISSSGTQRPALALALLLAASAILPAQSNVLTVTPPAGKTPIRRGETSTVLLKAQIADGYHANSNTPNDDYLIPLKLTWESCLLGPAEVSYPKPVLEKYEFSEKPVSVFTGSFEIRSTFKTPKTAAIGTNIVLGKLRYQACTEKMCLPPKTVE